MKRKLVLISVLWLTAITTITSQNTSYILNTAGVGGTKNTSFGNPGLNPATTGGNNTSTGYRGLFSNTSGNYNTAVGTEALFNNNLGSENTGVGYRALWNNTTGGFNSGNGVGILYENTTGGRNVANGWLTMYNNTTGTNNTADGYRSMFYNTTGSFNTVLGSGADVLTGNLSNASAIGANAIVTTNNSMILGDNSVNVGIGLSGNISGPQAKLHAFGTALGIKGDAGNSVGNIGVQGTGYVGMDGVGQTVGVRALCNATTYIGTKTGVYAAANGGAFNYGGFFASGGSTTGVVSYGVYSQITYSALGGVNYGIYSTVAGGFSSGNNNPNSPSTTNNAGYFNGDVVTTSPVYYFSDRRIKKDILSIDNSLRIISKLNPITYNFDTKSNPNIVLPYERQYGFISQEVKEILPDLTKIAIHPAQIDHETGREIVPSKEILSINYNGFIAILTKGIQEQQVLIETQQKVNEIQQIEINELKQMLNVSINKASGSTGINRLNSVDTGFQMSQNEPNPFTHETVVKYTLPTSVANAFMAVYDLTGKQITTFPIDQKGSASIVLTSEKLAAGIYIYSIVADGKVMDSKRMIVAEK